MKDLLYLKDEQIKSLYNYFITHIEKLFLIQENLSKKFLSCSFKSLNLIEGNPGINLGANFRLKVINKV